MIVFFPLSQFVTDFYRKKDVELITGESVFRMAGQSGPYHHLSMFYSDLFELGYEAVGELDSIADWIETNREGEIYYLKDSRMRGVLLWNIWGQVDAARALIAETGSLHNCESQWTFACQNFLRENVICYRSLDL